MAEARTRSVRLRSRAAGLFAAGYCVALTSFWITGAAAYALTDRGVERLAGLAYFPILLLPFLGHGTLGGFQVHSAVWVWWFALQMVLAVAAIGLNPYEWPRRRRPRRPRQAAPRPGLSGARPVARAPRI